MSSGPGRVQRDHLLGDAVRRHWLIVLIFAVGAAISALVVAQGQSTAYESTSKVLISPLNGNALGPDSVSSGQQITIAMQTEAGLVNSPSVASEVPKRFRQSVTAGTSHVAASVPPNTEIVAITYTAPTPELATAGSKAFADAFLGFRNSQAAEYQGRQSDLLQGQIDSLEKDLKKWTAAAAGSKPDPEASARVQLVATQLATLRSSLGDVKLASTSPGTIVAPATVPTGPTGISAWSLAIGGGLLGLLLGVSVALWREHVDDTLRVGEVSAAEAPVLGYVAMPDGRHAGMALGQRSSEACEGTRNLRSAVLARTKRPSVLSVSSISEDQTSCWVVTELAVSLGEAGYETLVVDLIGGSGSSFGVVAPSLREAMSHEEPVPVFESSVRLVEASAEEMSESGLLASPAFLAWLQGMRSRNDYVLIATPPITTAEGSSAARGCDGAAVVVRSDVTTHSQLDSLRKALIVLDVELVGTVTTLKRKHRPGSRHVESHDNRGQRRDKDGVHSAAQVQPPERGAQAEAESLVKH